MIAKTKFGSFLKMTDGSYIGNLVESVHVWEEEETDAVLDLVSSGDRCVDVGAHVGYYTCLMAYKGASVVAFEPNPALFEMLRDNVEKNGFTGSVRVSGAAISDKFGKETFHLPSDYDDGWGSLRHSDLGERAPMITVITERLEGFLDAGRYKLLKSDTEGAEGLVLSSLGDRIHDFDYVLVEMNDNHFKHFDTSCANVQRYLVDNGFLLVRSFGGNMNELWKNGAAR